MSGTYSEEMPLHNSLLTTFYSLNKMFVCHTFVAKVGRQLFMWEVSLNTNEIIFFEVSNVNEMQTSSSKIKIA